MRIRIPNNWTPRDYQRPLWDYLENGGRRAVAIWHRRAGKDDVCLHRTCVAAHERPATYWHMLPEANQIRKAIWEAINPHTGRRRIDEAFPPELRETTHNQEMFIRFKCGSTWQAVGSDNFNSLVGSPPAGVIFSEWALANPSAWAYLRPIIAENNGWALFITTPRGRNHAHKTLEAAKQDKDWFHQVLTAEQTSVFTPEQLQKELKEYIAEYGEEHGTAFFRQEFYCDFNAPLLGSYYGREFVRVDNESRITAVEYDPELVVYTAWDIGWSDDTAIWFFQVIQGEVHLIDFYAASGMDIKHYAEVLANKPYKYGTHWLPHDARAKTLAAQGRSIVEQLAAQLGIKHLNIAPNLDVQDGIQAVRMMFSRCWFDEEKTKEGIEALRLYQREYDDDKKAFKDKPRHDWTSHAADAFRYLALVWREEIKPKVIDDSIRGLAVGNPHNITVDELWKMTPNKPNQRI